MLIPITELVTKYGVQANEVIHLGAHHAEEAASYAEAGAQRVIWIEGNPELMPTLEAELRRFSGQVAYNVLVSDVDGAEVDFYVTNNRQSSSILPLGTHSHHHPAIHVQKTVRLKTRRMDRFLDEVGIDTSGVKFLNVDLQGVELAALRGLGERLGTIDFIYTEVNTGEVYAGCATIGELDRFLLSRGFVRVATRITSWQWGDALYERRAVTWRDVVRSRISLIALAAYEGLRMTKRFVTKKVQELRYRGSGCGMSSMSGPKAKEPHCDSPQRGNDARRSVPQADQRQ